MATDQLFSKGAFARLFAVVLGSCIAAALVLGYLQWSDSKLKPRFFSPTPLQAVMDKLPQVAVIGQNPGPAGTTEVFIQIPGILNMQSVYVLSDNKTVISGFVLPNIEGKGVPGGQMKLPTGKPTVDPRSPREHMKEIMRLSGQTQGTDAAANDEPVTDSPDVSDVPAPQPMPSPEPKLVPAPAPQAEQSNALTPGMTQPLAGESKSDSTSSAKPDRPMSTPQVSGNALTLDDLKGSARFRNAMAKAFQEKDALASIKEAKGPKKQQAAYFDLLKHLPAVDQGDGPRELYVMFDANCPVCHSYYREVSTAANAGRVTVHWIPVTIFPDQTSSITAGAQLLRTLDRKGQVAARNMLNGIMTQKGFNDRLNLDFSDDSASSVYLDQMLTNTGALFIARPATPLIVFESTNGNLVVESGIPDGGYLQHVKAD